MSLKIIIIFVCYGVLCWCLIKFINRRLKRKHKGYITGMRKKHINFKFLFADMNKQYKEINQQFLWLLIATIGCLGISNVVFQFISVLLVFLWSMYQIGLLENQIRIKLLRLNFLKKMYGQHLTACRRKMFRRKMLQIVMQLWVSVVCFLFVCISLMFISFKFGIVMKAANESDNVFKFLIQQ